MIKLQIFFFNVQVKKFYPQLVQVKKCTTNRNGMGWRSFAVARNLVVSDTYRPSLNAFAKEIIYAVLKDGEYGTLRDLEGHK